MIDAYDVLGGRSKARREFLGDFAAEAFNQIFAPVLGRGDRVGARQRALPSDGTCRSSAPAGPRRGPSSSSASVATCGRPWTVETCSLSPASMRQRTRWTSTSSTRSRGRSSCRGWRTRRTMAAGVSATRRESVHVAVTNPLGPDGNPYVGSWPCPRIRRPLSVRVQHAIMGLNRTWFTMWTPLGTDALSTTEDGHEVASSTHRHPWPERPRLLPRDAVASRRAPSPMDLSGPVTLRRDGDDLVYSLTLWRQAKAIPDHWDLTVQPPVGWQVDEATVTGGGTREGHGRRRGRDAAGRDGPRRGGASDRCGHAGRCARGAVVAAGAVAVEPRSRAWFTTPIG